jgi:hypothetical protein
MRFALIAVGLLALCACTPGPLPPAQVSNGTDLNKYVEPTNGAAYSQGQLYYYTATTGPAAQGPAGIPRTK